MHRVDDQPGFVLHSRAYRNTSLLVEAFTRDHGRVAMVARGVRGKHTARRARLQPLRFHPAQDPVFFTHHPNWEEPQLTLLPVGQVFRAVRTGDPLPELGELPSSLPGEDDPGVPRDFLTQNLIGQFHYMLGVTYERRDWPRARASFQRAARAAPHNDVLFYNMGLIYRRNGCGRNRCGRRGAHGQRRLFR